MFGKRKFIVSGKNDKGEYKEIEVWARSANEALTIANSYNDGYVYTVARKAGCGC